MNKYIVYAIYSVKLDKIYIGQTSDLGRRLKEHISGYSFYTSRTNDWELFYQEEYAHRSEAIRRERQLKSSRGRAFLWEMLLQSKAQVNGPSVDGFTSVRWLT